MDTDANLVPGSHSAVTSTIVAAEMAERMGFFLQGYAKTGTIKKGIEAAGISRESVRRWLKEDVFGFRERYHDAHDEYTDGVEELLDTYNAGIQPGQNVLGILAALNANRPDKWRPNVKIQLEVPNEVIQQLRALQELAAKGNQLLAPKVVDGKAETLPWE